jgi:hypothetical protein
MPYPKSIDNDLRHALDRCVKQYGISFSEAWERLTDIPPVLLLPDVEANEGLDLGGQASLLRVSQGRFAESETVQWEQLDKKERRSAKKLAAFLDSKLSFPRQRPAEINVRLALYLIFALEELLGRKLPFSRSAVGGPPRGPAFKAVFAALILAQARVEPKATKSPKPNTAGLASVVEITRTEEFDRLLREQGYERTSAGVRDYGHSIALTIGLARKNRIKAHRRRRKPRAPTN